MTFIEYNDVVMVKEHITCVTMEDDGLSFTVHFNGNFAQRFACTSRDFCRKEFEKFITMLRK